MFNTVEQLQQDINEADLRWHDDHLFLILKEAASRSLTDIILRKSAKHSPFWEAVKSDDLDMVKYVVKKLGGIDRYYIKSILKPLVIKNNYQDITDYFKQVEPIIQEFSKEQGSRISEFNDGI